MSATLIKKIRGDLTSLKTDKIGPLLAKLEAGTPLTEPEAADLAAHELAGVQMSDRLAELIDQEMRALNEAKRLAEYDLAASRHLPEHGAGGGPHTGITLGSAYLASEAWQRYMKLARGAIGGELELEQFALIGSQDANGKPIAGYWKARDAALPSRRTPLLDACGSEQVGSGEFWWVEWPVTAPTAAAVPEGTAIPEASYPPVVRYGQLTKVGHLLPIAEEAVEDNARMRSVIEGALADGVRQKAETDAAAALVAAALPASPATGTLLEEIRRGVGLVSNAGFDPATVVLNPLDYAEIDIDLLTKTLNGARANSPLWALNVVPAGVVTQGTACVGDFLAGARVFWRSGVTIKISDSHTDTFGKDILTLKATQRITTKIVRPEAIVECTAAVTP